MYDVFEFIDAARSAGGRVLVHCSQGVSRSVALSIAYLMWRNGGAYEETFAQVKAIRGVASPNIGFTCQLLQWQKRRGGPPAPARVYRIAPHSQADPMYLVPRLLPPRAGLGQLDPRGAFVVHSTAGLYVWRGASCPPEFAAAAERAARQLVRFEGASPPTYVAQGAEPVALIAALATAGGSSGGADTSSTAPAAPGPSWADDGFMRVRCAPIARTALAPLPAAS
jgi:dual specificity MAP kinase phosphatase